MSVAEDVPAPRRGVLSLRGRLVGSQMRRLFPNRRCVKDFVGKLSVGEDAGLFCLDLSENMLFDEDLPAIADLVRSLRAPVLVLNLAKNCFFDFDPLARNQRTLPCSDSLKDLLGIPTLRFAVFAEQSQSLSPHFECVWLNVGVPNQEKFILVAPHKVKAASMLFGFREIHENFYDWLDDEETMVSGCKDVGDDNATSSETRGLAEPFVLPQAPPFVFHERS